MEAQLVRNVTVYITTTDTPTARPRPLRIIISHAFISQAFNKAEPAEKRNRWSSSEDGGKETSE